MKTGRLTEDVVLLRSRSVSKHLHADSCFSGEGPALLQAMDLYTLDCQLCARNTFFRALRSSWVGTIQRVHLEWRIDWIDCELSLFTPCSWLRRNVKIISSHCYIIGSTSWLLVKANAGRGLNTRPGIAKPVTPFHHSHRIAAVNNLHQTFHQRLLEI